MWAGRAGREREVVERIVALLFSLADLAERAAGRSLAVRWAMLWALWTAHDVARDFVLDCAADAGDPSWAPALPATRRGHDAQDALALSLSLRTLALMLQVLEAQARSLSLLFDTTGDGAPIRRVTARLSRLLSAATPATAATIEIRDTS